MVLGSITGLSAFSLSSQYRSRLDLSSLSVSGVGLIDDFNPPFIPEYDFTELNATWYHHDIEMIIVSPNIPSFINALEPLKEWKNQKGVKTIILNNWSLYEGRDKPEKIRNMIKEFYESFHIRWVLLAGDAQDNLIPIRYVHNPAERDHGIADESYGDPIYKPTDYYYADLTGTWDEDGDGIYGESSKYNAYGVDEIDWIPEVYVGRLPAGNSIELGLMVNKTIQYEANPVVGEWMNRMLLAGVISDRVGTDPDDEYGDGEDEARLTEYIWKNYVDLEMNFTHLYRNTSFDVTTQVNFPDNVSEITSNSDFASEFNRGYSTVLFAGHGRPTAYDGATLSGIYTSAQAGSASNDFMPSLVYADACTTSIYDLDSQDNNIGETLIKLDSSGAIGYVGGLRVTYYVLDDLDFEIANRANAKLFWEVFFEDYKFQQGRTLYDSKVAYMTSDVFTRGDTSMYQQYQRKNVLTYCLLGDPEVDIHTDTPSYASNPFLKNVTEGQLVSITIRNDRGELVPYARVHLTTDDGKYGTVYADENGVAIFRAYPKSNEIYNVTITGHNLVPSYFSFTTIADNATPEIIDFTCNHFSLSTFQDLCLNATAIDNGSGIESAMLLINRNAYIISKNGILENATSHEFDLGKLTPGSYQFVLFTRDYANNTIIYTHALEITVPIPIAYYLVGGVIIGIALVSGSTVVVARKQIKKSTSAQKFDGKSSL
ncbi:MAG: hypothetical protein JW891_17590 [Candidatus Lokiarchaeota archaeon]|nr:hypothetical protein [Candidatus Lokiarchaeota archaeon]